MRVVNNAKSRKIAQIASQRAMGVPADIRMNGSLTIGTRWKRVYSVSDENILQYAKSIQTENKAHLDRDAARALGFDDIVAPGLMSLMYVERAVTNYAPNVELRGLNRVKFTGRLYAPSSVTVSCKVLDIERTGAVVLQIDVRNTSARLAYGECRLLPR